MMRRSGSRSRSFWASSAPECCAKTIAVPITARWKVPFSQSLRASSPSIWPCALTTVWPSASRICASKALFCPGVPMLTTLKRRGPVRSLRSPSSWRGKGVPPVPKTKECSFLGESARTFNDTFIATLNACRLDPGCRADIAGVNPLAAYDDLVAKAKAGALTLAFPMADGTSQQRTLTVGEVQIAVVDGLCFVMKRELLDKVGLLDEAFGYMHCYDLDISLRSIAAGYKNVVVKVEAMHIGNGGRTRNMKGYRELVKDDYGLLNSNCRIFSEKWRGMLPLKIS